MMTKICDMVNFFYYYFLLLKEKQKHINNDFLYKQF